MAAIYALDGSTITEGLQGCETCDEAINMAREIAAERGEPVTLDDDDGTWTVDPDGCCAKDESADGADTDRAYELLAEWEPDEADREDIVAVFRAIYDRDPDDDEDAVSLIYAAPVTEDIASGIVDALS